jgi:hypothetical protein
VERVDILDIDLNEVPAYGMRPEIFILHVNSMRLTPFSGGGGMICVTAFGFAQFFLLRGVVGESWLKPVR